MTRTPRSFKVYTPLVNAGVEGTEFFVGVERDRTHVTLFEGRVVAENDAGKVTLAGGQSAVAGAGGGPVRRFPARRGCAEREGQGPRTGEKRGRGGPRVRRRPDRPLLRAAGGFRPGGIPFLPPGVGEIGAWERIGQGTAFGTPPILWPSG